MEWLSLFTIFLISLLILGFVFFQLLQNVISAPYVPSNRKRVEKVLKEIGINGKTFIDIGAGDGCIVRTAAKLGATSTGIEINPYLSIYCRVRNIMSKDKKSIKYIQKSFFKIDLSEYDVIYMYLYPGLMEKLEDKIFREMKKGAIVVSNTFEFKGKTPGRVIDGRFRVYYGS